MELTVPDEQPSREAAACQDSMMFVIKAEVSDPRAKTFTFSAQKTMYGGKLIATGDTIFIFASENEGGQGLIARGVVSSARCQPTIATARTGEPSAPSILSGSARKRQRAVPI